MNFKNLTLIIGIISLKLSAQNIQINGILNGQKINFTSTQVSGIITTKDIEIEFPAIPSFIGEIDIKMKLSNIDFKENLISKSYSVVKKPKTTNEVRVKFDIGKACGGDIIFDQGYMMIQKCDDNHIIAEGVLIYEVKDNQFIQNANDTITFSLNTSLYNTIPKFSFDQNAKNEKYDYYNLSGKINNKEFPLGNKFTKLELKGDADLSIKFFEIEMEYPNTDNDLALMMVSSFSINDTMTYKDRLDNKLTKGKFELIPYNREIIKSKILKNNQLYAFIKDDNFFNDTPVKGIIEICHISEKRISGYFKISFKNKDNTKGFLKGDFDIPLKII